MEGLYGNNSSRVSKLKVLDGNVSPITVHRDNQLLVGGSRYQRMTRSTSFDSYASVDNSNLQNLDPSLIRYLRSVSPANAAGEASMYRQMIGHDFLSSKSSASSGRSSGFGSRGSSGSPLSSMENLETPPPRSSSVFSTPLKVEEDVLVMDGILVGSVPSGRVRSSTSSDSSGSSSGSKSHFKTEICRPWEDSGSCRYGSKCQFAHGKEELRPTRVSNKNKSEAQICKSFTSSGTCTYGSKCRIVHHQVTAAASPTESAVRAPRKTKTISPIKLEHDNGSNINEKLTFTSTDWSPQDDGVEVVLPSSASTEESPSREEVNAYIHSILYGPIQRKRLPVFDEICPE